MTRKKKAIQELFAEFSKQTILVIGDVMVDAYLWGSVDRISPEAPVPIVTVSSKENRLGGAANVAINIQSMGARPLLCSVIGNGDNARLFYGLMQAQGLSTEGIVQSTARPTTYKTRVIGNNHQMLRIDEESDKDITAAERRQLLDRIADLIGRMRIDAIVFEDYDKGVISKPLIDAVVKLAREKKIPVAADPKRRNFNHYRHIDLFKPNLKELRDGSKLDMIKGDLSEIKAAAARLSRDHGIRWVMITLSERGVYLYSRTAQHLVPAHIRNIADVSGAGDTVISVAACCLAAGCDALLTASLANLAGGLVCEKVGVVPVEKDRLLQEALQMKS
jgi:rfaE bifunctional protein kinase chain/domain